MWDEIKELLKHTSVYGLGNLLGKLAGFLLIPFYTHYFRPAEYGTLELLDLSLALITMLLNVWVAPPVLRFYFEYEDQAERNKVVSTALVAAIIGGALIGGLGLAFSRGLSTLLLKSSVFSLYIQLMSVSAALSLINGVAYNYLRARQRSGFIVFMNTVSLVLALLLNIYFIAFLKIGILGVLISSLIANYLLNTVVVLTLTIRDVGLVFDYQKLKSFAAFGAPLIFTNIGAFILNFSDRFFLQHFSTVAVVGIYALGYKFGFMLSFLLIQPFNLIWSSRMYDIAKRPDGRQMISKFAVYFCLILAIGVLTTSVVIKDVIKILGAPDFRAAHKIVPLIGFSYLFQGMAYYFQTGIFVQKKTIYLGMMGIIAAISNLLLNFLLVPAYAGMGAAWATALSFLLVAILAYVFSQKVYPVPYNIPKLCMPILVAIVTYLGSTMISISSPALSIVTKLLLILPFLAVLDILGFFEKDEKEKFRSLLGIFMTPSRWRAAILPGR